MQPRPVPPAVQRRVLALTLLLGAVLFVWQLGSTGLVDETPPLFAASARAMAETGDWLIPRVNGLPRYDKPPLVYWAMGLLYALPGQEQWNPLGTWAARLPSALASLAVMLALAHTLLRWPQAPGPRPPQPGITALTAALAFALSPLVLLWGRIAVSDALFSGCLSLAMLLCWHSYAAAGRGWWRGWVLLGLAVLAKGPVALLLLGLTLLLFGALQRDPGRIWRALRPLPGLAITAVIALPWYGLALAAEGEPFWRSFFGYHNLQRFTAVVNHHQQPWWFFAVVLLLASLPWSPLLLLGLFRGLSGGGSGQRFSLSGPVRSPALSLQRFAACWLLAVLLFFTVAATKLPSYWLPATPAAGLLIALAAAEGGRRLWRLAFGLSLVLALLLALVFAAAPWWVPRIVTPEMPTLPADLLASRRLELAAGCYGLAAAAAGLGWRFRGRSEGLLSLQLPLVAFVPLVLLPAWQLGDQLRGLPVRQMAAAVHQVQRPREPLAMVGMLKPSLLYYARQVVIYEGAPPTGLVNLADRLGAEHRAGQSPTTRAQQPSVLVVIDAQTADQPHWRGLDPEVLDAQGIYRLWRLDRSRLERRAAALQAAGVAPDWQAPRPERY